MSGDGDRTGYVENRSLRLTRTGALVTIQVGEDPLSGNRSSVSLVQARALGGPRAMAMAMAMSRPQAMAMAMRPGAMAMAMAADSQSVPAFGDAVLSTWIELREIALLDSGDRDTPSKYPYERLPLALPPGRERTTEEIYELHEKERALRRDRLRQSEVRRQITANDPIDLLRPLGIEEFASAFPATIDLIQTVLQVTERVGYVFKARFARPRPNAVDPTLRPFLPNPPHASYPSNHAFQSFSVAHAINRAIPEIPGAIELFHVAQRIGENREYAGLHYESDTRAGEELARMFAPYLFQVCRYKMAAAQREWY
ncbi:phospholipid phosphatase [uncultured Marivita sp.]|uniref:phosphatase PAP2 family protein n=1 Tax=uncultured Marivita sp. TaxID=888080 RepID=UPI00262E8E17|nr:phospholipid phosphatase [uncultured Marivita sp.]